MAQRTKRVAERGGKMVRPLALGVALLFELLSPARSFVQFEIEVLGPGGAGGEVGFGLGESGAMAVAFGEEVLSPGGAGVEFGFERTGPFGALA